MVSFLFFKFCLYLYLFFFPIYYVFIEFFLGHFVSQIRIGVLKYHEIKNQILCN
jgi:hypothetical protein